MNPTHPGLLCSLHGVHVLLVDDDGECREMFRAILEAAGADVTMAASGREALETLEALELRPHAIVSDLAMPDGDGYWLIRQVRALAGGEWGNVPAVAVTAYGQRRYRERALAEGFSEYLEKPVDPDALCRLLADLVLAVRS